VVPQEQAAIDTLSIGPGEHYYVKASSRLVDHDEDGSAFNAGDCGNRKTYYLALFTGRYKHSAEGYNQRREKCCRGLFES